MTILEKIAAFFIVLLLSAVSYTAFDYWVTVRPTAMRLNEVIIKTGDNKELTRLQVYDIITDIVVKGVQKNNVPATGK